MNDGKAYIAVILKEEARDHENKRDHVQGC